MVTTGSAFNKDPKESGLKIQIEHTKADAQHDVLILAQTSTQALIEARVKIQKDIELKQTAVNKLSRFFSSDGDKIHALEELAYAKTYQQAFEAALASPEVIAQSKEGMQIPSSLALQSDTAPTLDTLQKQLKETQKAEKKLNNLNSLSIDFLRSLFKGTLNADKSTAALNLSKMENTLSSSFENYNKNHTGDTETGYIALRLQVNELKTHSKERITDLFSATTEQSLRVQTLVTVQNDPMSLNNDNAKSVKTAPPLTTVANANLNTQTSPTSGNTVPTPAFANYQVQNQSTNTTLPTPAVENATQDTSETVKPTKPN